MKNKKHYKNTDKSIKILVVYHKKDELFKNDILVPIHAGRAKAFEKSKDGQISKEDYNWLLKNMIGDDTDNNISHLNRELNELTAIYWAWKNYDKLGNPDYIGLNHYKRFFDIEYKSIPNLLNKYYYIKTGFHCNQKISVYDAWINCSKSWADNDFLDNALDLCNQITGNNDIENYFKTGAEGDSYFNMFILPKEEFFKYCEFLFSIIFKLPNSKEERTKAMFAERLTAYYLKTLEKKHKCLNAKVINYCYSTILQKIPYLIKKLFFVIRISFSN